MPTYTVSSKDGEVLEIVEAVNGTAVRVDASRRLLEIHQSTTSEIMEYAKAGKDVRVLSKKAAEPSKVDPAQIDLEDQLRAQAEAEAAEAGAASEDAGCAENADSEASDAPPAEAEAGAAAAFDFP